MKGDQSRVVKPRLDAGHTGERTNDVPFDAGRTTLPARFFVDDGGASSRALIDDLMGQKQKNANGDDANGCRWKG